MFSPTDVILWTYAGVFVVASVLALGSLPERPKLIHLKDDHRNKLFALVILQVIAGSVAGAGAALFPTHSTGDSTAVSQVKEAVSSFFGTSENEQTAKGEEDIRRIARAYNDLQKPQWELLVATMLDERSQSTQRAYTNISNFFQCNNDRRPPSSVCTQISQFTSSPFSARSRMQGANFADPVSRRDAFLEARKKLEKAILSDNRVALDNRKITGVELSIILLDEKDSNQQIRVRVLDAIGKTHGEKLAGVNATWHELTKQTVEIPLSESVAWEQAKTFRVELSTESSETNEKADHQEIDFHFSLSVATLVDGLYLLSFFDLFDNELELGDTPVSIPLSP